MQKTGNELTYDYDFYALNGLLSFLQCLMDTIYNVYILVSTP